MRTKQGFTAPLTTWVVLTQTRTNRTTDSVTMLTKEGFELRHEVFLHDAPAPAEVEEVVEGQV